MLCYVCEANNSKRHRLTQVLESPILTLINCPPIQNLFMTTYACRLMHTHTHTNTHAHHTPLIFTHVQYVCQHSTVILSLNSLAQVGYTALLLASYGGSVEVVRMLLEEFNNSLDQVNNVSVWFHTRKIENFLQKLLKI